MNKIEIYSMSYLKFDENSNSMNYQYESIELKDNNPLYLVLTIVLPLLILITGAIPIVLSVLFTPYYAFLLFVCLPLLFIYCNIFELLEDNYFYKQPHIVKEIADFKSKIEELAAIEENKCNKWREEHPFEEKVRLAMEKNPNYVADLIKYIKFELK